MDDYTPKQQNEDGLYEHYAFEVDKGQTPLRIDKYLMNFIENATRNKVQAAAKDGNICLLYTSPSPRDKRQSRMPSSA